MPQITGFEGEKTGAPPQGWTVTMTGGGPPTWTVERDEAAPSRNVLRQSSFPAYPIALLDGPRIRDGSVSVRFKTVRGSRNHAGGLIWRAQDAYNYYVLQADSRESSITLFCTVGGKRRALEVVGRLGGLGVIVPIWSERWHALRVEFAGSRFKVFFNHVALFEVEDATFFEAGQVGLWTLADGVTLFDAFACEDARPEQLRPLSGTRRVSRGENGPATARARAA